MITADQADWDSAPPLVAMARAESKRGGLEALLYAADYLEGASLAATGRERDAITILGRARDGFDACGARWEATLARLALSHALSEGGQTDRAATEQQAATHEAERMRARLVLPAIREGQEPPAGVPTLDQP